MRYILIANNKKLSKSVIENLELNPTGDIVVLFNTMMPIKYDKIKNHPRIWWIGRQLPVKEEKPGRSYAGIDLAKEHEHRLERICVHTCPQLMGDSSVDKSYLLDKVESYNFDPDKLFCMEPESNDTRKRIGYPKGKNMSSGVIVYEWIKIIKEVYDEIYLVGFTSELTKSFHNDNWEGIFFRDQIKRNLCKTIGSYELEQQKYNYIYNSLKWKSYLTSNHGDKAKDLVYSMNPESILDVGCGMNLFCNNTMEDYEGECTGLDFAGNKFDSYGDLCFGLDHIRTNQYDLVTAFDLMEHLLLSCVEPAFEEMKRVSKRFILKIDYSKSRKFVFGSNLHPTVKKEHWWMETIEKFAKKEDIKKQGRYIYGVWDKS